MAHYSFKLPDVAEGIVEVEILRWLVKVGDKIEVDQAVADVMTDKANVEISSPVAGEVLKLAVEPANMLSVGAELILLETDSAISDKEPETVRSKIEPDKAVIPPDSQEFSPDPEPAQETPKVEPEPKLASNTDIYSSQSNKVLASPAVRRRAREANLNLSDVNTHDRSHRISHQDLDAFTAKQDGLTAHGARKIRTAISKRKVSGLRRAIATKMLHAKRSIPHYSYVEEVDMSELETLRKHLNQNLQESQTRLTPLPFLMLAIVKALSTFPECNAHFLDDENTLIQYDGVHIGMATMTEEGLKVPVLHHVEAMDVWRCSHEIKKLSSAARNNKISLADLKGSTITLTSLGTLGGIASTPIINHPEVSIIGINKIEDRAVVRDEQIRIRTMMNISASFDHRIIDGYTGAAFVQQIKSLLQHPATLFI